MNAHPLTRLEGLSRFPAIFLDTCAVVGNYETRYESAEVQVPVAVRNLSYFIGALDKFNNLFVTPDIHREISHFGFHFEVKDPQYFLLRDEFLDKLTKKKKIKKFESSTEKTAFHKIDSDYFYLKKDYSLTKEDYSILVYALTSKKSVPTAIISNDGPMAAAWNKLVLGLHYKAEDFNFFKHITTGTLEQATLSVRF